jgi:hypothetical protein
MNKEYKDLVHEIYKELMPLNFEYFYIKPILHNVNKDITIKVESLNELENSLKQLIKECASSIDYVYIPFEIYKEDFRKMYYIHNPFTEDLEEFLKPIFDHKTNKKEIIVDKKEENPFWCRVFRILKRDYNVSIIEDPDKNSDINLDFLDNEVRFKYSFIDNNGKDVEENIYLSKSDLLIVSIILAFESKDDILVLSPLSIDAQILLKRIFLKNNFYSVDPSRFMTSTIASKANVIICNYNDYQYINTWKLNKETTIIDLTLGFVKSDFWRNSRLSIPLKESLYDSIDKIYKIDGFDLEETIAKMIITVWEATYTNEDD